MKFSPISLITVMLVVTAVALAGCSGSSPSTPSTPATTSGIGTAAGTPSSGSPAPQVAAVSGADLFGGLSYSWVEYKMSTGSGNDAMTVYMKWNRQTGKCTMRFEGAAAAQMPAGVQEMDCTGQATQGDPNQVSSDTTITCSPLDESVTVPAGTFSATKCTVTSKDGTTGTTWVARGRFMVKMEASSGQGTTNMVLNAYG